MGYIYKWASATKKGLWDSPEPVCQAVSYSQGNQKPLCVLSVFRTCCHTPFEKTVYPSSLEHKFKLRRK